MHDFVCIYRQRDIPYTSSSSRSCCSTFCCLIGLIAAILIAAALAIGLYFIIKSANDGDSTNNSKFEINT